MFGQAQCSISKQIAATKLMTHIYISWAEIALRGLMSPVLEDDTNYKCMPDGLTDGRID